jgi:D-sedoheptulose 7-phosphate isomerase
MLIETANSEIEEKIQILNSLKNSEYLSTLSDAVDAITDALKNGHRIFLAGNGGSAADAQHFAGEIVGRFMMERKGLPAMSLCVDPSVMTCIGNDYGYDEVFARQLEGLGQKGDVFIGISTSGNSENIIRAIKKADEIGITTVAFLGKGGGKIKDLVKYPLIVPSNSTPRIQEIHTFTVHMICEAVEKNIFG